MLLCSTVVYSRMHTSVVSRLILRDIVSSETLTFSNIHLYFTKIGSSKLMRKNIINLTK